MVKQAVMDITGKQLDCRADINKDSYIDHQSVGCEEIFKSMDELKSFIFDEDSRVDMGNDNV